MSDAAILKKAHKLNILRNMFGSVRIIEPNCSFLRLIAPFKGARRRVSKIRPKFSQAKGLKRFIFRRKYGIIKIQPLQRFALAHSRKERRKRTQWQGK